MRLLLLGLGPVGRSFVSLVVDRHDQLVEGYGLDVRIAAAATSSATWLPDASLRPEHARRLLEGADVAELPGRVVAMSGDQTVAEIGADVLVEATSGSMADGEPAASRMRAAMARGMHVVAASKGALLWQDRSLRERARNAGVELRMGAATGAALPTLDVAGQGLAGSTITAIEGVLNGTSNYVLTRMARHGSTFAEALNEARRLGAAEADPLADVDGTDTATKLVLIGNALLDARLTIDRVEVTGIVGIRQSRVARATRDGGAVRLVGSLRRPEGGGWRAAVAPIALPQSHPLAHVDGLEKAVTYYTDTLDRITVAGGRSDPMGAAAAILRDVVNLSLVGPRR